MMCQCNCHSTIIYFTLNGSVHAHSVWCSFCHGAAGGSFGFAATVNLFSSFFLCVSFLFIFLFAIHSSQVSHTALNLTYNNNFRPLKVDGCVANRRDMPSGWLLEGSKQMMCCVAKRTILIYLMTVRLCLIDSFRCENEVRWGRG